MAALEPDAARGYLPHVTLQQIPLHAQHEALGAKTADFGGWQMPIEYAGTVSEHMAVRERVGVFDVSHMGTARITGAGALDALNAILANDLRKLTPGQAQYTMLCNEHGGVIDDLIAYVVNDDDVMLVPNASNSDEVLAVLKSLLPTSIAISDLRSQRVMLAIQGPDSANALATLGLPADMPYMSFATVSTHPWSVEGAAFADVVVCRTGYTGEHGYEVLVPVASAVTAWQQVLAAGVTPCGLGARDTLRLEMGYALHGHELSADITPVEAGLNWAVGWKKESFRAKDVLTAQKADGPKRILRGLRATVRGIPRAEMNVMQGEAVVGVTTSGTFSPSLQVGIALALLDPAITEGSMVEIDVRGRRLPCEVTKPPFVQAQAK